MFVSVGDKELNQVSVAVIHTYTIIYRALLYISYFICNLTKCKRMYFVYLSMLVCVEEHGQQHALAFTPQQYLVAERHSGNVRFISDDYFY